MKRITIIIILTILVCRPFDRKTSDASPPAFPMIAATSSGAKAGNMIKIPAGEFIMGSSPAQIKEAFKLCKSYFKICIPSWYGDEAPQHKVYLDAYLIDKHEVTLERYTACVKAGKCTEPMKLEYCNWGRSDRVKHPINCLTWDEAKAFCEWDGKRLPTEAEWEKAARGTDGRIFPWGDQWNPANANYCDSSCGVTWRDENNTDSYSMSAPVESFPKGASPYGVMDMAGNVLEWTADWYDEKYYSVSPLRNPKGPASGKIHVIRGGSWMRAPSELRTASRGRHGPSSRHDVAGMRCAKSP